METAPNGFGTMNGRADHAIDENGRRQATEAEAIVHAHQEALAEDNFREAVKNRALSPEVAALNEQAHLEIFGSGNATYTDPETGEVVASPERPVKGVLAEMAGNPRYGNTQEERDRAVENYKSEVENLLANGFELTQIKLIQDQRDQDKEHAGNLAGKLIAEGENPLVANKRAKDRYVELDNRRLKVIKEGGAFTWEEYKRLREGQNLYDTDGNLVAGSPAETATTAPSPDELTSPREEETVVEETVVDGREKTEKDEKNEKKESLKGSEVWRREAINPENIVELKKKFEEQYAKELADHNIDPAKSADTAESAAAYIRNRLVDEYLKVNEREWDAEALKEIRSDVIHLMQVSVTSLNMLTLKDSQAELADVEPEPVEVIPTVLKQEPKGRLRRMWNSIMHYPDKVYLAVVGWGGRGPLKLEVVPDALKEQPTDTEKQKENKKRRCLAGAAVGALLGAGAVGAAWYLSGRHGGPMPGAGVGSAHTHAHEAVHTWNNTGEGHRYVQSMLPDGLTQHQLNGHEILVNRHTGEQLPVTYLDNGAYSHHVNETLHNWGYDTHVANNPIFDTDGGPGPTGQVNSRWMTVVTPHGEAPIS